MALAELETRARARAGEALDQHRRRHAGQAEKPAGRSRTDSRTRVVHQRANDSDADVREAAANSLGNIEDQNPSRRSFDC